MGCDLRKWLSACRFSGPPLLVLAGRLEGTGVDISLLLYGGLVGAFPPIYKARMGFCWAFPFPQVGEAWVKSQSFNLWRNRVFFESRVC